MTGYIWPTLPLVPEEPDQVLCLASFREQHPAVFIREGTGYWQAQIPEPAQPPPSSRSGFKKWVPAGVGGRVRLS